MYRSLYSQIKIDELHVTVAPYDNEWGWAAPAKKNEASIFFPPAKIEGARGHNECRNATRIIMDMDHKSARESGR